MDRNSERITDSNRTLAFLDEMERVKREKPDPQVEIFDRIAEFDREQAERWRGRIIDENE